MILRLLYRSLPAIANFAMVKEDEVEIPIQINGRLRGRITISADADEQTVTDLAAENEKIKRNLEGKTIRKVIFVRGRLINIIAK